MFVKALRTRRLTEHLLTAEEDKLIRDAFGRYKKEKFRAQGEALIAQLDTQKYWLACDCQPEETRPPFLTTVKGRYVRREKQTNNPRGQKPTEHAEGCDFEIDADEQRKRLPSYRRSFKKSAHSRFKLLYPFPRAHNAQQRPERATSFTTRTKPRSKLAQLLCYLLDEADLSHIRSEEGRRRWVNGVEEYVWDRDAQVDRIRAASQRIYLATGIPLSDRLALSFAELDTLKTQLGNEDCEWAGSRPHGIFLEIFADIDNNTLIPYDATLQPVIVNGSVSISKEGRDARRGPYLVVSLIAKLTEDTADFEIVRAYAHPCVAKDRFTLIDSNMERRTLHQILTCRDWLRSKFDIRVNIEKPLFDMGPDPESDEDSRPVCIPDFIVRSVAGDTAKATIANSTIVIETMGIWSTEYRARKERMRPYFEAIDSDMTGVRAVLEIYDPIGDRQPEEITAEEFWHRLRKGIARIPRPTKLQQTAGER